MTATAKAPAGLIPPAHPDAGKDQMREILSRTALFVGLGQDAAERLIAESQRRSVPRDRTIFVQGDPGDALYVILRGKVRIGRPAGPSRENLLTLLGPGDFFGELTLFDPSPRRATATAVTDVELSLFTAPVMRNWLQDQPEAAWHFLQLMARRLRRTNDALENLLFADVPRRVARALMDMASRFGDVTAEGVRVHHELTQEQLAQYVGASRESVNKALSDLANRGVIRLEPRTVVIIDPARLRRKAS
jgi:CRP/FNR family transcriptional regulator, cyclic AMP receptor protein